LNDWTVRTAVTREELIKEYRVREILEAARRVIGRYGFDGTTIDRVAEEARIAKGTIYLYFGNKDDLLHAAVIEGIRSLNAELRREDNPCAPPLERIENLVRNSLRIQNANQDFLKALMLETRLVAFVPGDPRAEALRAAYMEYLGHLAGALTAAIEAGAIRRVDPMVAAFTLSEMVTGTLRRRLFGLNSNSPEEDADGVLDMFLNGVSAAPGGGGR